MLRIEIVKEKNNLGSLMQYKLSFLLENLKITNKSKLN